MTYVSAEPRGTANALGPPGGESDAPRTGAGLALTVRHDVAVVSGIRREASIRFLCQSLTGSGGFTRYPAVVIDIRKLPPLSKQAQADLDETQHVCLTRHQWLGIVRPGDTTRDAVLRARRWLRLVEGHRPRPDAPLRATAGLLTGLAGVAPALWNIARPRQARGHRQPDANKPLPPQGRPS